MLLFTGKLLKELNTIRYGHQISLRCLKCNNMQPKHKFITSLYTLLRTHMYIQRQNCCLYLVPFTLLVEHIKERLVLVPLLVRHLLLGHVSDLSLLLTVMCAVLVTLLAALPIW